MRKSFAVKLLVGSLVSSAFADTTTAQMPSKKESKDWRNIPIPAAAGDDMEWSLHPVSDDFRYKSKADKKHKKFHKRWIDMYINPWRGPGDTYFNEQNSTTRDGMLVLHASPAGDGHKINAGMISSKETVTYPLYLEARAKPSNLTLANGIWMLSADSTEEIDAMEAYGSDRPEQGWFDQRMHISHHVFVRKPFQDYQPTDPGSWVYNNGESWRDDFHTYGVHWKDPWTLDYYIDGKLVRTVAGKDMIDPKGYTKDTGLSKPMHILLDMEHQDWRDVKPTAEELADPDRTEFLIDWIRVYTPTKK